MSSGVSGMTDREQLAYRQGLENGRAEERGNRGAAMEQTRRDARTAAIEDLRQWADEMTRQRQPAPDKPVPDKATAKRTALVLLRAAERMANEEIARIDAYDRATGGVPAPPAVPRAPRP